MKCHRIKPLISQYIDQTLSPAQAAQVRNHLADCSECTTFRRELAGVVGLLRASPPRPMAAGFTAQVMQRVRTERVSPLARLLPSWGGRFRLLSWRVLGGSLATALLVVATVCLRTQLQPEMAPETQSFVEECMADYELYASARPAVETTPFLLGSWGDDFPPR